MPAHMIIKLKLIESKRSYRILAVKCQLLGPFAVDLAFLVAIWPLVVAIT